MAREGLARLALLTRHAPEALMTFLFPAWYGPSARYRPENHYMRGPGPKWRAKYLAEPVASSQQRFGVGNVCSVAGPPINSEVVEEKWRPSTQ